MTRVDSDAVRTVIELDVEGRLKMKWLNAIECDMRTASVYENDVGGRIGIEDQGG